MKFLKNKKYSILSNFLKYSFVGVFAVTILMSTFFVNNHNKVESAVSRETITAENITSTSVDIAFLSDSGIRAPYTIKLITHIKTGTDSNTQIKLLKATDISYTDLYLATVNFINLNPGTTYDVDMTLSDGSGVATTSFTTLQAPKPEITSISPTSGAIGGIVTIYGNNFKELNGVYFGSIPVDTKDFYTNTSTTQVTAAVPSGFINGKITVKTTNGDAVSSDTFYAYNDNPYNIGKITADSITTSSVDIIFSSEGKASNRTYAIDLKKKNNPTSDTNKVETFKNTDVSETGLDTISFTGLISNTDYIATITSQAETSEINFKTLPKPGDKIAPTIYTTDVTSDSVSVNFSITNKSDATPPYTVTVTESNQTGEIDPANNQFKTIEIGQISDMGVATLNFTGLKPSTDFKVKLVNDNIVLSEINFSTSAVTSLATITSVSPSSGKVGDTIAISGENFTGVSEIYFNGISTISSEKSKTDIVVKVPVDATSGFITMKVTGTINPDGSNNDIMISSPTSFDVLDATGAYVTTGTSGSYSTSGTIVTPTRVYVFNGLVPVCNTKIDSAKGGFSDPCDFDVVMALINKLIGYVLVTMATPLFALIIIYVGWLYLSDMGSSENITKAKKILKNAVIGYVIALAAWLIVKTILTTLGFNGPMFLS